MANVRFSLTWNTFNYLYTHWLFIKAFLVKEIVPETYFIYNFLVIQNPL